MHALVLQLPSLGDMSEALRLDLATKLILAVLAGGAIGLERQIAGKAAGLRTNILICVGSALIMDLSMRLEDGPAGYSARIAANVVTGIGFIGAGTIMQSRGAITGLTSAATIWVVAAIGLTVGAGFYIESLGATATVMCVLAGLGWAEHRLLRARRSMHVTVRTRPGTTREWLQSILGTHGLRVAKLETFDHADDRVFELRLVGPARQFEVARTALTDHADVLNVFLD